MDSFEIAEDYYTLVETHSVVLNTEVLLQLFSLYIKTGKREQAIDTIKKAVHLNPDYPDVTDMARALFEDYKDWGSAIELAVNEAIRTESLTWFTVLEEYAERGLIVNVEPNYLNEVILTLYNIDKFRFESFLTVLWESYKQSELYFRWLKEINELLLNIDLANSYKWKQLPNLFEETYFELISGKFLIKDFSALIQDHFSNWLKVSYISDPLVSSTAVIAWNKTFPTELDASLVSEAEFLLEKTNNDQDIRENGLMLLESIQNWAKEEDQFIELSEYINLLMGEQNIEEGSNSTILHIIKKSIEFLFEKRVEVENSIIDTIKLNEESIAKLKGIHHHLIDVEEEKVQVIKKSFRIIKDKLRQELMIKIPELLRSCSDMVNEDSNFRNVHNALNEEMNNRMKNYMEETAFINFRESVIRWIADCEGEFKDSQTNLDEIIESYNYISTKEEIVLDCDFKVLDDWRRDLDRMTRGVIYFEEATIMTRNTPSQMLLKSTGLLFGTLSKNKEQIVNKYIQFIERADYSDTAQFIINPLIQQLEFFEKTIERDISLFFKTPFDVLNQTIEEVNVDSDEYNEALSYMRGNPEIHTDPLTLFTLNLCQYELMNAKDELFPKVIE